MRPYVNRLLDYGPIRGNEEEGWLATASPHAGPATHGQAIHSQGPLQGATGYEAPPVGTAGCGQHAGATPTGKSTARGHGRLRPVRRGGSRPLAQLLTARRPQRGLTARHPRGVATREGLPPATNSVASRGGSANRRDGCPLAGQQPAGKGSHRLHRGSGGDDDAKGKRGVRASFQEKDDPTPINLENSEDCP
ncbi:hypothetical protein GW17_00053349 [Ensete ventricosum]|nr:hypothetical protein GW17_00053349 [Ensete ventricosum]